MNLLKYFLPLFVFFSCYSKKIYRHYNYKLEKNLPYQAGCYINTCVIVPDTIIYDFYILYQDGTFFHNGVVSNSQFAADSNLIDTKQRKEVEGWGYYKLKGKQIELRAIHKKNNWFSCLSEDKSVGIFEPNQSLTLFFKKFIAGNKNQKETSLLSKRVPELDSMNYSFRKLSYKPDSLNCLMKTYKD